MRIFLMELPVFLLLAGKSKVLLSISFCAYIVICSLMLFFRKEKAKISMNIQYPLLTIQICLIFSVLFYLRWNTSPPLSFLNGILGFPTKQTWLLCTSLLAICSVFGVDYLIKQAFVFFPRKYNSENHHFTKLQTILFVFLCGLIMITLNSKCSPLYPFNDWDDVNTIFTVGKSILKGYVPYKDLYEQKGPLLLFLQVPAAVISFDNFTGLWIIEIIFAFFYLYYSYKTAEIYIQNKAVYLIPILACMTYSSYSFSHGAAAEEFCLPFLTFGLYIGCSAIQHKQLPTKKDFFLIGITSACVLWIKYSILGFYLGWFLFFLLFAIQKKQLLALLHRLMLIGAGVILLTLPIFFYFVINKALGFLWQDYFYNLIFLYGKKIQGFYPIVTYGFQSIYKYNNHNVISMLLALLWFSWYHYKKSFVFLCLSFIGLFTTVFGGGMNIYYYVLVFNIYNILGLLILADIFSLAPNLRSKLSPYKNCILPALIFLCSSWICMISYNMSYLRYEKEDIMPYKIAAVVKEKGIENPNIITWDWGEAGVNTVMGLIPGLRYFCYYNNPDNTENRMVMEKCLTEQCADVIIHSGEREDIYPEFENYDHMGAFPGFILRRSIYYHYYMPKDGN